MKMPVISDMSPSNSSEYKSDLDESEFHRRRLLREKQKKDSVESSNPAVALGMPLYNQTRYLPEALSSILAQTFRDFRLFVLDDSTDAGPQAIIERFAARDDRIVYVKNKSRKGMVDNWKSCFQQAGGPAYFAWVSDHDVWHARWLESMVQALNANPAAVLVYPCWVSIDLAGRRQPKKKTFAFSTKGLNEAQKIRAICREAPKFGYMVYGLFRASALRRCGIFRRLLFPDAILAYELCLQGEFIQVDEDLWFRRKNAAFSIARQKKSLFIRKPWYIYLP